MTRSHQHHHSSSQQPFWGAGRKSTFKKRSSAGYLFAAPKKYNAHKHHHYAQHAHLQAQRPSTPYSSKNHHRSLDYWAKWLLYHPWFRALTIFFTFTALFADDFRVAFLPKAADPIFGGLAMLTMLIFAFHLVLSIIANPDYRSLSGVFLVALDLLNIGSLYFDVQRFDWNREGNSKNLRYWLEFQQSRAAFRAACILRLLHMVRSHPVMKNLRRTSVVNSRAEGESEQSLRVERRLDQITTWYLLTIVLILIFSIPWLDGTLTEMSDDSYRLTGLSMLHRLPQSMNATGEVDMAMLQANLQFYANKGGRLVYIDLCVPQGGYTNGCPQTWPMSKLAPLIGSDSSFSPLSTIAEVHRGLRSNEVAKYTIVGCYPEDPLASATTQCYSVAYFSLHGFLSLWSALNILKTTFIILVLVTTSLFFSRDAQRLVIGPIQRMTTMVRRLADNPLAAIKKMELGADDKKQGLETMLLEKVLTKIGHLVQIGFGAAGAEIISKNLMDEGGLNAMVPGKKITSIYGFCDIRQFTDTTECLQTDVMTYVNSIASIVHGCASSYYGCANKNVGDAFLLSWKLCDGLLEGYANFTDIPDDETRLQANEIVRCPPSAGTGQVSRTLRPTEMADSSLTAFLKCQVDMEYANIHGTLATYRQHPAILARFDADFKVKMGFGMHVGWAIEGAIGSSLKIDATYISPHVEMAERLEASSKKYGSPLVMSHWFVMLLSPAAQSYLRPVDCIVCEGVPVPITLYTFDIAIDIESVRPGFAAPKVNNDTMEQISVDFESDVLYRDLQAGLHPAFLTSYRAGFESYLDGDWNEAQQLLRDALSFKADDKPILRLLNTMESHNYIAPDDWTGCIAVDDF